MLGLPIALVAVKVNSHELSMSPFATGTCIKIIVAEVRMLERPIGQ